LLPAVLHATVHAMAHPAAHLAGVSVGASREAEAECESNCDCNGVRAFHDRFLSAIGWVWWARSPVPATRAVKQAIPVGAIKTDQRRPLMSRNGNFVS
jgi:hypothetical protein